MKISTLLLTILVLMSPAAGYGQAADAVEAQSYLSYLSSQIVFRPLTAAEVDRVKREGSASFSSIVAAWVKDPRFIDSAQIYVESMLRVNGVSDSIDYNLPGYLGRDIARKERPYSDLVTTKSCVNGDGATIACDSGAPFTAGILTMRAFLAKNAGAYNIRRASRLMSNWLCTTYPLPDVDEPKIAQADLIDNFATTAGKISFGNGNNCYSCHSQFGHHAQFFVKFDQFGKYISTATGAQNPAVTDGFSLNNTYTSHYRQPARAANESSQVMGRVAANLGQVGTVLAENPRFLPCAVEHLMAHYLRLPTASVNTIKPDLYSDIAKEAKKLKTDPSLSHLLTAIITHPAVYASFKKSGVRP